MLEVHHRMHMLWSRGRKKRPPKLDQSPDSSTNLPTLTVEAAAKEWLEATQRYEFEQQTESAILETVADELLASENDIQGGASLLCFDEVQVRWRC